MCVWVCDEGIVNEGEVRRLCVMRGGDCVMRRAAPDREVQARGYTHLEDGQAGARGKEEAAEDGRSAEGAHEPQRLDDTGEGALVEEETTDDGLDVRLHRLPRLESHPFDAVLDAL